MPILRQQGALLREPHVERQLLVADEVPVLPVHRHEEGGTDQGEHQLQFLLTRMPRRVHLRAVDHFGALTVELVDRAADHRLVAGDGGRGKHHRIAGGDRDHAVRARGHARQRGERLALASRGQDRHLPRLQPADLVERHQGPPRDRERLQLRGDGDGVHHAPARQGDLAAVLGGGAEDLRQPVDVAGERRDQDPAVRAGEDLVEGGAHDPLRRGVARPLHVGRVHQEHPNPRLSDLREPREIGRLPVDRGLVELEVAGPHHRPRGRSNRDRAGLRDAVIDVHELDLERPDAHRTARPHRNGLHRGRALRLLHPAAGEPEGQRRAEHRGLHGAQEIGQPSDVVLVPVGERDAVHNAFRGEKPEVRNDQVDPRELFVREHEPGIDDQAVAAQADQRAVLADLPQSADRNDLQAIAPLGRHGPGRRRRGRRWCGRRRAVRGGARRSGDSGGWTCAPPAPPPRGHSAAAPPRARSKSVRIWMSRRSTGRTLGLWSAYDGW